eukprot:scaffold20880_cov174-Amphora_coffeaeformis.AAC.4
MSLDKLKRSFCACVHTCVYVVVKRSELPICEWCFGFVFVLEGTREEEQQQQQQLACKQKK